MIFHVVGLPHTQVTRDFGTCAFTQKVRKFCDMMTRLGHEVFVYAGEVNGTESATLVPCISADERLAFVGEGHYSEASFDYSLPTWTRFNARVAEGIRERAGPRDVICLIGGLAHKQIADALPDMMAVEFGIGYGGTFARYRVWESYAWMHTCYGAAHPHDPNAVNGEFYDAVIPSYFEVDRFPFRAEKDDYFLFMGRLTERKGFQIAADVCERLGERLILAGVGEPPSYGEYVGVVDDTARGRLMSGARAVFVPTLYIEPFGSVAAEAMLCGTPVISTDWGAMVETVQHGVTGFRCRTLGEFQAAAHAVASLSPHAIHEYAVERYSMGRVAQQYQAYFDQLAGLWGDGAGDRTDWYTTAPGRIAAAMTDTLPAHER